MKALKLEVTSLNLCSVRRADLMALAVQRTLTRRVSLAVLCIGAYVRLCLASNIALLQSPRLAADIVRGS